MSEEQRNEETEVEAHGPHPGQGLSANDEPRETDDEVEAHGKHPGQGLSANDEPDDEVEGHIMKVDRPKPHS